MKPKEFYDTIEKNPAEPPSYFRGHLYYYDEKSENTMRWVLYDGQEKIRFISRTALENYVIERQVQTPERCVELIMRAYARVERAYKDLDEAAAMVDVSMKLQLEATAVQLRQLDDRIDTIISLIIKDSKK